MIAASLRVSVVDMPILVCLTAASLLWEASKILDRIFVASTIQMKYKRTISFKLFECHFILGNIFKQLGSKSKAFLAAR